MTKKEASLILNTRYFISFFNYSEFSNKEEIKKAYKACIIQNHPDRSGSPYIASKITEAKNIMDI